MMVSRLGGMVIMIIGFTVLARLLVPTDFGLFAMSMAIYGVLRAIAEFGMLQHAVRTKEAVPPERMALAASLSFALSALGAAFLTGGALLLSPTFLPELAPKLALPLALSLLIGPLILQREAYLQRAVEFGPAARAGLAGAAADVAIAISLALAGFGVLALTWGFFAGVAVRAIWLMATTEGSRVVGPKLSGARELTRFGRAFTFIGLLPKLADLLLIWALGAAAGAATVGLYNRASRIRQILDETLLEGARPVMLPAIAAALRAGTDPAEVVARKLEHLTPICWAGFAAIILLADPLVHALLGPGWDETITAVRILALGGLAFPFTKMSLKLFTALDRLPDFARIQTWSLAVRTGLGAAMAFVSLEAFCAALAFSAWLKAAMIVRWEWRMLDGMGAAQLRPLWQAALATAGTLVGPALLLWATSLSPWALLALAVPSGLAGWFVMLRLTKNPLGAEIGALLGRLSGRLRVGA